MMVFPFQEKTLADKWAEEFSETRHQDQMLEADADFWEKLQKQWEELAKWELAQHSFVFFQKTLFQWISNLNSKNFPWTLE